MKIEQDLMKVIPKEKWILFSHQIIHHGRALCVARNPQCAECKLNPLCYAKDKNRLAPDWPEDAALNGRAVSPSRCRPLWMA